MNLKITLFGLLTMICFSTLGRSPAVEPVSGISIDQYQEVEPSNDPGFNWNQKTNSAAKNSLITTRVPAQNTLIQKTTSQSKSLTTTLFLIGLLTLPFFLWKGIMKGLDKTESSATNVVPVDLMSEREKRSQSEEQDVKKKAS